MSRLLDSEANSAMSTTELYNSDAGKDPPPAFATEAEIEMAERLKRQLEERYLAPVRRIFPQQISQSEAD